MTEEQINRLLDILERSVSGQAQSAIAMAQFGEVINNTTALVHRTMTMLEQVTGTSITGDILPEAEDLLDELGDDDA